MSSEPLQNALDSSSFPFNSLASGVDYGDVLTWNGETWQSLPANGASIGAVLDSTFEVRNEWQLIGLFGANIYN